jgi:anthranilate synthase component 1
VRLETELLADPKERAEHLMLVDLARNDAGRVCKTGSVHLSDFFTVERYSHVMHIVSRVQGELKSSCDALDALSASFPAGTVSGAPKVRAMQIISELERSGRGLYAGAAGYLDYFGNLDTCIAIRTLVFTNGRVHAQAGAGVVADSVPKNEEEETRNKARALLEALGRG